MCSTNALQLLPFDYPFFEILNGIKVNLLHSRAKNFNLTSIKEKGSYFSFFFSSEIKIGNVFGRLFFSTFQRDPFFGGGPGGGRDLHCYAHPR